MRLIKIWSGGGYPMAKAILQETRANPSRRMSKSKRRELMSRFLGSEQAEKIMEFGERERREKRAFASGMREINRLRARGNPSRRGNVIRVGDMVMGIMGVDGGYVGRVTRISGNIVTFKDDETGKERQTTEYNLTKNIPLRGEYPRRNPSRRGLLQVEKDLKKRAKRMGLTGERARAYIYGTYGRIKRASGY
jgi:hypothetical protein